MNNKDEKIRIDIEDVLQILELKQVVNKPNLNNIEFHYNDIKLDIPAKMIKDWKNSGSSNVDFIGAYFERIIQMNKEKLNEKN